VACCAQLSSSNRGLVQGACECLLVINFLFKSWLQPNNREFNNRNSNAAVFDALLRVIPLGTLEEHTVNLNTYFRGLFYVLVEYWQNISPE
jgi:hypothetical protein